MYQHLADDWARTFTVLLADLQLKQINNETFKTIFTNEWKNAWNDFCFEHPGKIFFEPEPTNSITIMRSQTLQTIHLNSINAQLHIYNCPNLEHIITGGDTLTIDENCTALTRLICPNVKKLILSNMPVLKTLECDAARILCLNKCQLPNDLDFSNVEQADMINLTIQSLKLPAVKKLNITHCSRLVSLTAQMVDVLRIDDCNKLTEIYQESATIVKIYNCYALNYLVIPYTKFIKLSNCHNMDKLICDKAKKLELVGKNNINNIRISGDGPTITRRKNEDDEPTIVLKDDLFIKHI